MNPQAIKPLLIEVDVYELDLCDDEFFQTKINVTYCPFESCHLFLSVSSCLHFVDIYFFYLCSSHVLKVHFYSKVEHDYFRLKQEALVSPNSLLT